MIAKKLLLVSEDIDSSKKIQHYLLIKDFYNVDIVSTGTQALAQFKNNPPNLVLLDSRLPDMNGIEVCKEIRKTSSVPIFLISSDVKTDTIITCYEAGVNDYIIKPFNETIIASKIYANIKTSWQLPERELPIQNFKYKALEIDMTSYEVKQNGKPITLIAKELKILLILAKNPNKIFSAEQLYNEVWETESFGDARTVMVHISNLRKKIEPNISQPEYIQTIRGFGYKFYMT